MMTLWCMFGSPLMIGGELTKLDDWTQFLLTRRELLQMLDADYVGRQVARDQKHAVWSCVNEKKDERYLALFNFMEQPARCEVALPETEAFADMCGQTGTSGRGNSGMEQSLLCRMTAFLLKFRRTVCMFSG